MTTMFRSLAFACAVAVFFAARPVSSQEPTESAPKIKALIIDGQNNHPWEKMTPVIKTFLEQSGRFTVDVATAPIKPPRELVQDNPEAAAAAVAVCREQMKSFKPDFAKYDVLLMNYNGDGWPEETKTAFEKFVAEGGGLLIHHAADNAFGNWDAYSEMIGIGWRHANVGPYLYWEDGKIVQNDAPGPGGHHGSQWEWPIDVREPEHPIMKGMPPVFRHCRDELYDFMRGPGKNVTVLATVFADTKYGGSGRHEPALMTIDYGKGRVFHTILGHDDSQCKSVSFIITYLRGAEWAATGKVTIPIPDDMPGPDKPAMRKFD